MNVFVFLTGVTKLDISSREESSSRISCNSSCVWRVWNGFPSETTAGGTPPESQKALCMSQLWQDIKKWILFKKYINVFTQKIHHSSAQSAGRAVSQQIHFKNCKQCGRAFSQSSHLKAHQQTHTTERPHLCSICGKSYSRAFVLKVHLRVHTGEKPYTCEKCGKCFYYCQGYRAHLKIHNKKPKTPTKPLRRPKQLFVENNQ